MTRPPSGDRSGTSWTMVTNLAIVFVSLFASVMVARSLGPQGRGEFCRIHGRVFITMIVG